MGLSTPTCMHAWPLQLVRRQRLITSNITSHHNPTGHSTENRPDQWLDLIIQTCVLGASTTGVPFLWQHSNWLVKRTRHATCHPGENPYHAFSSVWLCTQVHPVLENWTKMHETNFLTALSSQFQERFAATVNHLTKRRMGASVQTERRRLHARPRPPLLHAELSWTGKSDTCTPCPALVLCIFTAWRWDDDEWASE